MHQFSDCIALVKRRVVLVVASDKLHSIIVDLIKPFGLRDFLLLSLLTLSHLGIFADLFERGHVNEFREVLVLLFLLPHCFVKDRWRAQEAKVVGWIFLLLCSTTQSGRSVRNPSGLLLLFYNILRRVLGTLFGTLLANLRVPRTLEH